MQVPIINVITYGRVEGMNGGGAGGMNKSESKINCLHAKLNYPPPSLYTHTRHLLIITVHFY